MSSHSLFYLLYLRLKPCHAFALLQFGSAIGSNTTNVYVDRFAPVILIVSLWVLQFPFVTPLHPSFCQLFAVLTLIHAFERLLRFIGSDAITYPVAGNPEHEDRIRDGKRYLARGKKAAWNLAMMEGSTAAHLIAACFPAWSHRAPRLALR